ncbi:MAG: DUF485 domain-containing protein [Spirochaetota bacterium]
MNAAAKKMLDSFDFKKLVKSRWMVAFTLTVLEFILYYGYIILISVNKPLMSQKIAKFTTIGIPIGIGVIVLSWIFTFIYIIWANNAHDPEVKRLKTKLVKG